MTVNRFNQGVVSGVDVAQAQTQFETTRAQATDLRIRRAQLEHAIATLTGQPPAALTIAPSAGGRPPPPPPPPPPAPPPPARPRPRAAARRGPPRAPPRRADAASGAA